MLLDATREVPEARPRAARGQAHRRARARARRRRGGARLDEGPGARPLRHRGRGERDVRERPSRSRAQGGSRRRVTRSSRSRSAHPYPFGSLFDDALWHASLIEEKLGRSEAAIEQLRELLATRESSHMTGSYERPRYSPAQMRIAELYRDALHDRRSGAARAPQALRRTTRRRRCATTRSGRRRGSRRRTATRTKLAASSSVFAKTSPIHGTRHARACSAPRSSSRPRSARARTTSSEPCRAAAAIRARTKDRPPPRQPNSDPRRTKTERLESEGERRATRQSASSSSSTSSSSSSSSSSRSSSSSSRSSSSSSTSSSSSSRGLVLEVDADVAELRLEQLEELVDVVAAPLVEDVGQELEEVAAVEATLDLFDLLLGERLEDVLAQRFGVAFFDGVRRRESDLPDGTLVEVDLHERGSV